MSDVEAQYQQLRRSVAGRHGEAEAAELDRTFAVAEAVHRGQQRKSGDPYITHPVAVASLVHGWGLPPTVVRAALAHDIGDTPRGPDVQLYEDDLGPTVIAYVRAVRTLDHATVPQLGDLPLDLTSTFDRNTAMIKIADRLHNARTWQFVPLPRAQEKARHTLTLFAPTASALDLAEVAEELRSLSAATLAQPAGVVAAFLSGALRVLPPALEERYRQEWLADLAQLEARRERAAMAAGLLWSAWAIRRQVRAGR